RQLSDLTALIEQELGVRPTTYRAGRNGFNGASLPILERLGFTVDTSVDPLFNERRKGGMVFAGAPVVPYHPDYRDVRRRGSSKILEVPISAATSPALPKSVEALYARLRPIPWRGALRRLGLKAVWLRRSYGAVLGMLDFAECLACPRRPCPNPMRRSARACGPSPGGARCGAWG